MTICRSDRESLNIFEATQISYSCVRSITRLESADGKEYCGINFIYLVLEGAKKEQNNERN